MKVGRTVGVHPRNRSAFLPRDYVRTPEGLAFAVVGFDEASRRVLGTLRYCPSSWQNGVACGEPPNNPELLRGPAESEWPTTLPVQWRKLSSTEANSTLRLLPEYTLHCRRRDCVLPAVPVERVAEHYRPEVWSAPAAARAFSTCKPVGVAAWLCEQLVEAGLPASHVGVTGSLLIGAGGERSDVDLVVYGRSVFRCAQEFIASALESRILSPLSADQWERTWERRGRPMDLQSYVWHEERKFNKAVARGVRFDVTLVQDDVAEPEAGQKVEEQMIRARVLDASRGFDWPAVYVVEHTRIDRIETYTGTYFGQAFEGEFVEARGIVERLGSGQQRLIIGADREAAGHYLRVAR